MLRPQFTIPGSSAQEMRHWFRFTQPLMTQRWKICVLYQEQNSESLWEDRAGLQPQLWRHVEVFGVILRSFESCCLCFGADDFPESTGVKRIVQALNANVWSNVVMKGGRCWGALGSSAGDKTEQLGQHRHSWSLFHGTRAFRHCSHPPLLPWWTHREWERFITESWRDLGWEGP